MRDSDQGVEIKSTFIKVSSEFGGSWAVRFAGRTLNEGMQGVSLVYYFGLKGNGTLSTPMKDDVAMVRDRTPDLSKFRISIIPVHSNQYPVVPEDFRNIGGIHSSKGSGVGLKVPKTDVWKAKDAFQDCADKSLRLDIEVVDGIASNRLKEFDTRFEFAFILREKGFSDAQIELARNALSSLIGGIGYFHGSGLVSSNPKSEYGHSESKVKMSE
ncbi:Processing alpha glucosidase I [Coemansia aciculifera]|nr:Processing alpha glucosidase I [Coemansia aciculifera]